MFNEKPSSNSTHPLDNLPSVVLSDSRNIHPVELHLLESLPVGVQTLDSCARLCLHLLPAGTWHLHLQTLSWLERFRASQTAQTRRSLHHQHLLLPLPDAHLRRHSHASFPDGNRRYFVAHSMCLHRGEYLVESQHALGRSRRRHRRYNRLFGHFRLQPHLVALAGNFRRRLCDDQPHDTPSAHPRASTWRHPHRHRLRHRWNNTDVGVHFVW